MIEATDNVESSDYILAVQVRNGSSRLPGKMTRDFFDGLTIPELMVRRLIAQFPCSRLVIATSLSSNDDEIAELAAKYSVRCHRGFEDDVLGRVADAVRNDPARWVVRICGDNPFLLVDSIQELISFVRRRPCDYASFSLPDGTPSILSHLGLFAEIVSKSTLMSIAEEATAARHREHLTSHILDHPRDYDCEFLDVPPNIVSTKPLRLTVDTLADFEVCQNLYHTIVSVAGHKFGVDDVVHCIQANPEYQTVMAREIAANEKQ